MEKLSALMDGEVEDHAVDAEYLRLKNNPDLREAWNTYHLIGDALRGQTQLTAQFDEAVKAGLATEPTLLAPRPRPPQRTFRRTALAIAASACGIALVAWLALYNNPLTTTATVVAEKAPPPALQQIPARAPDGGPVNEYLLAHQQFSPSTALGMVSYVRTVSGRSEAR